MIYFRTERTRCKVFNPLNMLLISVVVVVILFNESTCLDKSKQDNTEIYFPLPFEEVNYTTAVTSSQFNSSTKHNAKGMGHLYMITRSFMNLIFPGELYPEGLEEVLKDQPKLEDLETQWRGLVRHYGLVALVVLLGLVFVLIMPMIGLCFFCCRCAGRCGASSQPFEKRYDPCRRHVHGLLLSGITILIAFGVVCAFVTNEYLESATMDLPQDVHTFITDTDQYINNTKKQVNNLLIFNFEELEAKLNEFLYKSGETMKEKLGEVSKAEVIGNLTSIVGGLNAIRTDLRNIDNLTLELKGMAIELEQALAETRDNLREKLHQCISYPACKDFLQHYDISNLNLEQDFAQLPNVTASLHNISALLDGDIEKEVSKGKQEFEKVQQHIQRIVDEGKPVVSDAIRRAGLKLREGADRITGMLERSRHIMITETKEPLAIGEKYLQEYGPYQHYLGLGVSCTLLLVLTCLTFGLFCGYCGKRPDGGYNDDCCDKGTGSKFLMMGVWIMFVSWAALMIITAFYFMTGVLADKAVCHTLRDPNSRLFKLIDQKVVLPQYPNSMQQLRLSNIVRKCHNNETLYSVFELQNLVDISRYPNLPSQLGINSKLDEITGRIRLENHVDILTPSAKRQLLRLANSPLNQFNPTIYTNVLNEKITSIDLTTLANAIKETAEKLPENQMKIKHSLKFQAQYLELHQQNQVSRMKQLVDQLGVNANNLTEHLRFNEPSLKLAVDKMLAQVQEAQKMLNEKGPEMIAKIARGFGQSFAQHITEYMHRVLYQTEHTVGKCWPMSQVYNATLNTVCNKVLEPYNGFWASVGFILVLFIPSIILAVKLASLYQKSDPYPGPLVEAEYLYDAYADRDNIPLANVNEKKKKKQHSRYDNNGAAGGDRGHGGGSGSQDQRYSDIAPKHWDFANMSPPHYNGAPISTEYERPPPYYYPGPSPSPRS